MNFSVMDELQAYLETERSEHRLHYNELQLLKRGENLACGDLVVKRLRRSLRRQTVLTAVLVGLLSFFSVGMVAGKQDSTTWETCIQWAWLASPGIYAYRMLQGLLKEAGDVSRVEVIVSLARREAALSEQTAVELAA